MSTQDGDAAGRSARDAMLGRIRAGLAGHADDGVRKAAVAARLAAREAHLVPERVAKPADGLRALLRGFLEGQSATVIEAATPDAVPSAVANFLRSANLPQRVRTGADPFLANLDWSREPTLERQSGRAEPGDEASLSRAVAAVAETGTLVLTSGSDNPVTLNFLPETHIVVLAAKDIVGPYEAAFDRVRAAWGQGVMPRTVNLVSGPSRTADVGGKLVTGAHGPRRLCVIIVDRAD